MPLAGLGGKVRPDIRTPAKAKKAVSPRPEQSAGFVLWEGWAALDPAMAKFIPNPRRFIFAVCFTKLARCWHSLSLSATASVFVCRAIGSGWQGPPNFSAWAAPPKNKAQTGWQIRALFTGTLDTTESFGRLVMHFRGGALQICSMRKGRGLAWRGPAHANKEAVAGEGWRRPQVRPLEKDAILGIGTNATALMRQI